MNSEYGNENVHSDGVFPFFFIFPIFWPREGGGAGRVLIIERDIVCY